MGICERTFQQPTLSSSLCTSLTLIFLCSSSPYLPTEENPSENLGLFYCSSREIHQSKARAMLFHSFLELSLCLYYPSIPH
ncbi:unnamed protein product [Linum trigynum]|uniref:Uncharacterized protein n=2 Tax=Linum TaxID=4005 RepID=A0AAV2GW75_9ROSI